MAASPDQIGSTQKANVPITFGPITAFVSVHTSVADPKEASLRMVCTNITAHGVEDLGSAGGGMGYVPATRIASCPVCGSSDHIGRAKELAEGLVPIPADVLAQAEEADQALGKEILLRPHPAAQVEALTRPLGSRFYLNVKGGRSSNYALLRALLEQTPDIAYVAHFSLKGAALPYRLVLDQDTLMLVQLSDPANIRMRPEVSGEVNPAHLEWATRLAQTEIAAYEPEQYVRPKTAIIAGFVEGKPVQSYDLTARRGHVPGEVGDLLAALKSAVAAKRPARKAPVRKTAAAPAAATPARTAAKKTTAKRATRTPRTTTRKAS